MPVGVGIGGAVIGAGASIIGGNAQSDAIEDASDAQTAAAREATALQRDIYNQNVQIQQPFLNTGMAAMGQINALLGLQPQAAAAPTLPAASGGQTGGPLTDGSRGFWGTMLGRVWEQRLADGYPIENAPPWIQQAYANNPLPGAQAPGTPAPANNVVSQPTAQAAYDQFKNYTGYTSRLTEANNAMNSAYAGRGTLQSGAAQIAMGRMNQDYASREFGNYMGYLGGQQQLGPGAANALGGVGTNYANSAGNIAMQNGNNLGAAAIAQGNNTANMWGGIASGIGGIAGSMFGGSSYSDERLKKDIEVIRIRSDGLPVKSWIYRNDPEQRRYEGHVAQDVAKIYPKAVIENFNGSGFLGVNYAEIPAESKVAA